MNCPNLGSGDSDFSSHCAKLWVAVDVDDEACLRKECLREINTSVKCSIRCRLYGQHHTDDSAVTRPCFRNSYDEYFLLIIPLFGSGS